MFQLPAFLSVACDAVIIFSFFTVPEIYHESQPFFSNLNPVRSCFLLVLLAGLRIILFAPLVFSYQRDQRVKGVKLPMLWAVINVAVLLLKASYLLAKGRIHTSQWIIVAESAFSLFFQMICLQHLRSSVLPDRHVVLDFHSHILRKRPSRNHVKGYMGSSRHSGREGSEGDKLATDSVDSMGDYSSNERLEHLTEDESYSIFLSSDFLGKMRKGFEIAKRSWMEKMDDLDHVIDSLTEGKFSGKSALVDRNQEAFEAVLSFYTRKQTVEEAIHKMLSMFQHHQNLIEFYLPQLAVYMVYGSFSTGRKMPSAMFHMCRQSIAFAHKLHWFIAAFCIEDAGVPSEGCVALRQLLNHVELAGDKLSSVLERERPPMVELALAQLQNATSEEADSIVKISPRPSRPPSPRSERGSSVAETLVEFIRKGGINQWARLEDKYPVHLSKVPNTEMSAFRNNIDFWDKVVDISRLLGPIPGKQRNGELRAMLDALSSTDLPSNTTYVPVGETKHRIYSIHSAECFAFSTKDRAPMLLCIEIVPYDTQTLRAIEESNERVREHGNTRYERAGTFSQPPEPNSKGVMEKWGDALLGRTEEEDSSSPSWQSWWLNITAPNAPALGMDIDGGSRTNSSDFLSPQRKSGDDKTYKYSPLITAPRNFFQPFNDTISSAAKMLNPGNCGRVEAKGAGAGDSEEEEEDYGQWNLIPKGSKAKENLKLPYRYHAKSLTEESALKSAIIEMKDYSNSEAAFETSDPTMLEEGLNLCNEESTFQTSYPNSNAPNSNADLQSSISGRDEQEDPSAEKRPLVVFKEPWKAKEARLRKESPVGHLPGWKLVAVIVKSGDDLRQEQLAAQLIKQMQFILDSCGTKHWLQPYDIVAFSPDSGLIEAITDTVSLDALRRSTQTQNTKVSMLNFFESFFGPEDSKAFQRARDNFTVSLATYCIVCYILSLKDRHNGNLLLDNKGHIMHIDFGFILGKTPGGNIGFEKAPFKLTNDFIELMDGAHSAQFHKFRDVCVKTYMALRRHHRRIVLLLEMLARGNEHLPCFAGNPHRVIEDLRKRFRPELHDRAAMEFAHSLINASMDSWTTTCYDRYQKVAQGIF